MNRPKRSGEHRAGLPRAGASISSPAPKRPGKQRAGLPRIGASASSPVPKRSRKYRAGPPRAGASASSPAPKRSGKYRAGPPRAGTSIPSPAPNRSGKHRAGLLGLQSRFVRGVEVGAIAAGGLALAVLAGLTVVAVFRRYVLNDPIFGVEDLSAMTLAVVVAAAVAGGACRGAHVGVNVIGYCAGRRITRVSDAVARLLGLGAAALAAYALFAKGSCGLPCGAVTGSLSIVHTPFYYALGTALAACALLLLIHFLVGLAHWNGEDPNAPGG